MLYFTLHVLKATDTKLRKAKIAIFNQETLKSICECALKLMCGKVPFSACNKRKLRTYKNSIRKVADKRVSLANKRKS